MTLYDIKPRFQNLLRPLVAFMATLGITANQVTLSACFVSVGLGLFLFHHASHSLYFLLLPVWMFLRMALNAIDGMLAREFGQKSKLGAYLNELTDVIADAALFLPFALVTPFSWLSVSCVIFLATLSEFAGVMGLTMGASRRYDGPFGKSDRALMFGALGFFYGILGTLPAWLCWLMPAMSALLLLTLYKRINNGLQESDAPTSELNTCNPSGEYPQENTLENTTHVENVSNENSPTPQTHLNDALYLDNLTRKGEEKTFTTHDQQTLFYRHWPASKKHSENTEESTKKAIVLFHRGHEHSCRMAHLVDELTIEDADFFAWDARGHGLSPGKRGFSPSLGTTVRDIDTFIHHITETYGIQPHNIFIVAQSVGAVLAATWVHDYAPKIRGMVLASPAFKVKLYVPFARTGIKIWQAICGQFFVNSYVKANFLSHDPQRIHSYNTDPLITRPIASHILLGLYDAAERVVKDAGAITVPTQLLISGADFVVHHKPQHQFYENLGSAHKERHILPGFYHDTLGELERAHAIEKARHFILDTFAKTPHCLNVKHAYKAGFTRTEADSLASPLPLLSPRGMYWASTRAALKFAGGFSDGVKLGHRTGFDSGSTLDYVYENIPRGKTLIGRLMDYGYLNSVGWRGIRQRKVHLEELINKAMYYLHAENTPISILDIAAGHGRYILEALEQSEIQPEMVLLRDYSDINVTLGQQLIQKKNLEKIAQFEQADAFSEASYTTIKTSPNLAVVSGVYELFSDNQLIRCSLAGISKNLSKGSYLVYTNQPWHPQLEMIARALTSHRQGDAWIMRRRTQQEMDQLVEEAGFTKLEQRIDEMGIFTVSLAIKLS